MKNRILTLLLAAAMTITGFAMPMTAYGAEEAETAPQTEAVQEEAIETENTEAIVETEPEQVETPEATEGITEAATESETQESVAEQETNTVSVDELGAMEENTEEEDVVLMMSASAARKTVDLAPTSLKAVSASYNSIKLTWKSVSGVSRYTVYVSTDKKTWKKYDTVTGTTCTVKDLATKRTRYFKVESVIEGDIEAANEGNAIQAESSVVSAKALMNTPALKGKLASNKLSATLSWAKVPGAAGYKVYKYDKSSKTYKWVKTISSGSTLSYKVTPTPGIKNYYKVRAYRKSEGSNVFSDYSKYVKFDLTGEDSTSLKFKAGSTKLSSAKRTGSTSGTLTWKKVSGASGYSVYKYDSSKGKYVWLKNVKGAGTLKTNVKLSANKATSFKVRAYKDYKGKRIRNSYSSSKKVAKLSKGEKIVSTGKSKLGCPYVWGASGPNAFDCSGFVMWVMKQHGISLPHNAAGQYYALASKNIGTNWHNAKAGDVVFYSYGGPGSSHHVGIYVGNGKVMHASSSHGRVVITSVTYSNGHIAAICRP